MSVNQGIDLTICRACRHC